MGMEDEDDASSAISPSGSVSMAFWVFEEAEI